MIVSCVKELQEANEEVRKIHDDLYESMDKLGKIWSPRTCVSKGCKYCLVHDDDSLGCTMERCYHNKESWSGCRIPYMDYCSKQETELEPEDNNLFDDYEPEQPLPEKVTNLIKIECRKRDSEVHIESVPVIGETDNCYELKNGDFVYKKNGERRSPTGRVSGRGKITVKYYPPTKIDELQYCPGCGKPIFYPFEILKKTNTPMFVPIAKVCPHCGFKIPIREGN